MKGVYTLLIELDVAAELKTIRREFILEKGYYAYIGSAMNNVQARIQRHLSRNKNRHWHIDFLLDQARVTAVFQAQTETRVECQLAREFADMEHIRGFGCSDCNCPSHLFYSNNESSLREKTITAFKDLGLDHSEILI